jgi:hypothetical protein
MLTLFLFVTLRYFKAGCPCRVVYSIRAHGQPVLTYQHIRISYQLNFDFGIAGYTFALTGS